MYSHSEIEKKWTDVWGKEGTYTTDDNSQNPPCYVLSMFPYPSGEGLHGGHARIFTGTDVYSRFKRMKGYNVLHPMGWDAFGLPTLNYAIKENLTPREVTKRSIDVFKKQSYAMGWDHDWSREINTSDPSYYKWTQWIFLKLYEKGLLYQTSDPLNWCAECKTTLADEDLENGLCERCSSPVEKKSVPTWTFHIRKYAQRLLDDLDTLTEWPEYIKEIQRNWIGKSKGSIIPFSIEDTHESDTNGKQRKIHVFTTRADTLMGATYLVLAPEHPLASQLSSNAENSEEIDEYIQASIVRTEEERVAMKEKTGIRLDGVRALHPITKSPLPIFLADYVLARYGTGAVMAVPSHDKRDYEFSKKFSLPSVHVIDPLDGATLADECYTGEGRLVNSGEFNGLSSSDARVVITERSGGEETITWRLRDWSFSRPLYWGEPIPLVHIGDSEVVPLPASDLPVLLPEVSDYKPKDTAEPPLSRVTDWKDIEVEIEGTKKMATRETSVMPGWAGSNWYYLRFIDPHNRKSFVSKKKERHWMPVDVYVGGAEHAARHLLYARFWHKALYDSHYVSTEEPFKRLIVVGLLLGADGKKMSKRFKNGIVPQEIIDAVGADAFRLYLMFMAPFTKAVAWNDAGIAGPRRFLERVYELRKRVSKISKPTKEIESALHKTIEKVEKDIESFHLNTVVSELMIFLNTLEECRLVPQSVYETFLKLLAPFCPFITEELWRENHRTSIHSAPWPTYAPSKIVKEKVKVVVQINGKKRALLLCASGLKGEEVKKLVQKECGSIVGSIDKTRFIWVQDRIINFFKKREGDTGSQKS